MISRVLVRSLGWMKSFLKSPISYRETNKLEFPVAVISIRDILDDTTGAYFVRRAMPDSIPEIIGLYFYDATPETKGVDKADLFNETQALQILDFIKRLHSSKENYTLIVHCVAGICRSAAVGEVVSDLVGIKHEDFEAVNYAMLPNTWVKKVLREVIDKNNFCLGETK